MTPASTSNLDDTLIFIFGLRMYINFFSRLRQRVFVDKYFLRKNQVESQAFQVEVQGNTLVYFHQDIEHDILNK